MNKKWLSRIIAVGAFMVFIAPGFASASTPERSSTAFPSDYVGTWKRDNFNNTITLTATDLKSSSQYYNWGLQGISGDVYTIKSGLSNSKYTTTITMRLTNGSLVISGDSGTTEDNWNGTWKRQAGIMESVLKGAMENSPDQQQQQQLQPAQASSQYWTGNGGRGMRLGILVPHSQGLNESQGYLPALIQGVLVTDISKYSAISVLDRVSLDRIITETLDLTYEDDFDIVRLGHVAQVGYMMTGNIIKTSAGFSLQINVTDTTPQANTVASYSGTCTAAELDNYTAIHRASLELLSQMKVQLTARARNELNKASSQEEVNAQTALARGVTAQRQGTEVEALSYFFQAFTSDPSLAEAEARLDILTASITSGSISTDARGDIQLRNQWMARLKETEQFITKFMRENRSYYLVYSSTPAQGAIDYAKETITLSIDLFSAPEPVSFETINKLTRTVRKGLVATGRSEAWGLNWPSQSVTTPSPFFAASNNYPVTVELLNAAGKSVGRQSANLQLGGWFMPDGGALSGTTAPYLRPSVKLSFPGVAVKDIDGLKIRVVSVNNVPADRAASQMGLRILPQDGYDSIQSVMDNGLQTANLQLYDIRFDQGKNLLKGFSGSTYAAIPYGVTHIDRSSGLYNKGLTSVKIPSSVTIIESSAFSENLLTSVTIPDSVTSIGSYAFSSNRLTSVFIGNSVTSIGNSAFNDSTLRSFTIGADVTVVDRSSLGYYCTEAYTKNNRRAGTYTSTDGQKWNYSSGR